MISKKHERINALAEIRDYLREWSENGEIPQTICDDFNFLATHLTGTHQVDWCVPSSLSMPIVKKWASMVGKTFTLTLNGKVLANNLPSWDAAAKEAEKIADRWQKRVPKDFPWGFAFRIKETTK